MNFDLSDEHKMLKNMAYKFAVNEIAPISFDCDKEEKYTPDIRKKAAQQGLVAAWVPEAYGGAGVGIMGNAKLSLAYENLKVIKPEIIYCSLTGYGQDGPMATRAGHDINYIARSGIASYSGKKEQGPSLMGMQIADVASAIMRLSAF